jgi:predicted RNase H-like nuclease (RuvC/YqgF family)
MTDKWEKREKKVRSRQSVKEYGKPFKRLPKKDSKSKKNISKLRKKLQQEENNIEELEDSTWEY